MVEKQIQTKKRVICLIKPIKLFEKNEDRLNILKLRAKGCWIICIKYIIGLVLYILPGQYLP